MKSIALKVLIAFVTLWNKQLVVLQCLLKNELTVRHIAFKTGCDIEYCIMGIGQGLVIGFVYCPLNKHTNVAQLLMAVKNDVMIIQSKMELLLMGDFNFENNVNKSVTYAFKGILILRPL